MRQYRLVPIAITGFFMWLTLDMWNWFMENHDDLKEWTNASFIAVISLAAGAVKWSLENIRVKYEQDEEDV